LKKRKEGISKKNRPKEPERNRSPTTKVQTALNERKEFKEFNDHHNDIRVKAVLADALYGECYFMNNASKIFGGVKNIGQLNQNQNIWDRETKK